MRYRRLGNSGLLVSELALGTATFGGGAKLYAQIGALPQSQVNDLVRTALDAGVNLIDTADVYSEGIAEEMVGNALRTLGCRREEVVIATKVGDVMCDGPNRCGASRKHIEQSIEASLRRLQLDYVDLYQLHDFDPLTPMEETLEALDSLVRRGLVRYIGVSNWSAWQLATALGISAERGVARYQSQQSYYSLAGRDAERDIVPMLEHHGLGLLVWGPLAGGSLTGKYRSSTHGRRSSFDFPPVDANRLEEILAVMDGIAQERSVPHAAIAIAWLLSKRSVSSVILGATSARQLEQTVSAGALQLNADELGRLNAASNLRPEYPAWMQELKGASRLAHLNKANG